MLSVIWLELLRKRLRTSWWAAVLLGIAHTLIGVLSVKAFAVIEGADAGAMSLFGGVFFMPLTYILGAKLFKRPLGEVADVFTPVMGCDAYVRPDQLYSCPDAVWGRRSRE